MIRKQKKTICRLYLLKVDTENNADLYWTPAAKRLFESIVCVKNDIFTLVFETREKAEAALDKFRRLPNWSHESYPAHAPHPLIDEVFVFNATIDNFIFPD